MPQIKIRGCALRATLIAVSGLFLAVSALGCAPASIPPGTVAPDAVLPAYWPTADWRTSSPEQQGMDSARLAQFFQQVQAQAVRLEDAVIIRHGYIVAEAYAEPFGPEDRHVLHSCTKSILSALIGIAIGQGLIDSVDAKLLSFFPDRQIAHRDALKDSITLAHALAMSSGLQWSEIVIPYSSPDNSYVQMTSSDDWAQYALDQPMRDAPGQRFEYNTGGSQLLSAALQRAAGMNAAAFAEANLFKPLGITSALWPSDPAGVSTGGSAMQMRPRDSAKIGYLYLRGGQWDGKQIVPAEWISASVQPRIRPPWGGDGYGYHWWLFDGAPGGSGFYSAMGYAGQYILVAPQQDIVAVFNGALQPEQVGDYLLPRLARQYILPAAVSDQPLAENAPGRAALDAAIQAVEGRQR